MAFLGQIAKAVGSLETGHVEITWAAHSTPTPTSAAWLPLRSGGTRTISGQVKVGSPPTPGPAIVEVYEYSPSIDMLPSEVGPSPVTRATSDKDGRFTIPNLKPGRYRLVISDGTHFPRVFLVDLVDPTPYGLTAVYDEVQKAISLAWINVDQGASIEVHRAIAPERLNRGKLPEPIAVLPAGTTSFFDTTIEEGEIHYYALSVNIEGRREVSEIATVNASSAILSKEWRLFITDAQDGGGAYCSMNILQFRGVPGGPSIAINGTAGASSDFSSQYTAVNAFNNGQNPINNSNGWLSTSSYKPWWISYTFPEVVGVVEVAISIPVPTATSTSASPKDFQVQYKMDGEWQTAWAITDANFSGINHLTVKVFTDPDLL